VKRRVAFITGSLIIFAAVGVYVVVHIFALRYLDTKQSPNAEITCKTTGDTHTVIIANRQAVPRHTKAKMCDRLTIVNQDVTLREMAFGEHDSHQAYDGVFEKFLKQNESLTITLNRQGTYLFHDHIHDEVAGDFTVTN
jgi:hypothetical protein